MSNTRRALWERVRRSTDQELAYALFRIGIGLNFLGHTLQRLYTGLKRFTDSLVAGFAGTPLPEWLVRPFTHLIPWIELAIGLLLIVGLRTRIALASGLALMAVYMLGTAMRAQWTTLSDQVLYALAFFVLLFLRDRDGLALDAKD